MIGLLAGALMQTVLQTVVPAAAVRAHQTAPADSARIVRSARAAQISFESFRRIRLPRGERFVGPCDVRVGRYCMWRDDGDDESPPRERTDVRDQRNRLILQLDSASDAIPGDAWLAGQRVRYLVEGDQVDAAMHFASTGCRAGASWCAALGGYAAHAGAHFAAADSAFTVALAAMDTAERCRWLDVSDELDGPLADRFKSIACDQRDAFLRRVFWLAAPLYSVASSDVLTERFARLTRVRMAERSAAAEGNSWGDDQSEIVLRYGWSRWYTRTDAPIGSQLDASFTGHDTGTPYDFLPSLHAVDHVGELSNNDWQLENPRARSGYAPSYARSLHALPSQIATFRRGESTLVVAAWDARRDTTMLGRPLDAALVLSAGANASFVERRPGSGVVGRMTVQGVADSGVVSLELLAVTDRRAARARVGVAARSTSRIALSNLLFYSATAAPVYSLADVRDSIRPTNVVPATQSIGVYWETYGLPASDAPVRFTFSIEQVGVGWMRRAAERLHVADRTSGVRIQWEEVPRVTNGIAGRGVRVDPSQLRRGTYRVELSAAVPGESPVSSAREIVVE